MRIRKAKSGGGPADAGKGLLDDEGKRMMTEPFLQAKGFDVSTKEGRMEALEWLRKAEPNDMFYNAMDSDADAAEIAFDTAIGGMRKSMMINGKGFIVK